jgi:hypothetical protein
MILGVNLGYHSKKFYPLIKISILSVRVKLFVSPLVHSLKTYDSFLLTVMRIVQLMTDRSQYFNPSKNYWFSFNAFLISLIGLYFRCLSFRVVLVDVKLFVSPLVHSLKTYDSFLFIDKQRLIC